MKARCPHGSPWYVECWSCADEVIYEHRRKVVNFDRRASAIRMGFYWPRGCEPQTLPPGVHEFDGVPFFSSAHPQQGPTATYDFSKCEPLTPESFLRARTQWFQTLFGRHLTSVK